MEYIPTTSILKAIKNQLAERLAEYVGSVAHFDGEFVNGIDNQFGQALESGLTRFVIFGLADDVPDAISGSGAAIRSRYFVDFYAVVRSQGRDRYEHDIADLHQISDEILHQAFDQPNTSEEFRDNIASATVQFRRRYATGQNDYFVHVIRFVFQARRP